MPAISTMRRRFGDEVVPAFGTIDFRTISQDLVWPRHQAYVDTPEYLPFQWHHACGGFDRPLGGNFPHDFITAIFGAGMSGTDLGWNFVKSNVTTLLFEAQKQCGGRTSAVQGEGLNEYHVGSMRYAPSEGMLFELAYHFGFAMLSDFVDPGVCPTLLAFSHLVQYWNDPTQIPKGFETVFKGWNDMLEHGFEINGERFASFVEIANLLCSPHLRIRQNARPLWQKYIDHFKDKTLREIMMAIFVLNTNPPGGKLWSQDDLDEKWSKGGIGSGGFGIFFPLCALTILRFPPNEWEIDQCAFAEQVDGKWTPTSIQKLVEAILKKAESLGLETQFETELVDIRKIGSDGNRLNYVATVKDATGIRDIKCNLPILAFPPSLIVKLGLAREDLFPPHICEALQNVHMIETTKVFASLLREHFADPGKARVILGDVFQTYVMDFNDPTYLTGLLDYAWADNSLRYNNEEDAHKCFEIIKEDIRKALEGSEYEHWLDCLENIKKAFVRHWQTFKYAGGAFTFLKAGQDKYCSALFHYKPEGEYGVDIATASVTPYDGWLEGALIKSDCTYANAADRYGEVYFREQSPIERMIPYIY